MFIKFCSIQMHVNWHVYQHFLMDKGLLSIISAECGQLVKLLITLERHDISDCLWTRGQTEIYGLLFEFVAPPGRKSWLLFSVRDMPWGLRNPSFTKLFWSVVCKWPVINVTLLALKIATQNT